MMSSKVLCFFFLGASQLAVAFVGPSSTTARGGTSSPLRAAEEYVGMDVEHVALLGKSDTTEIYDPLGFSKIHDLIKEDPEHFGVWPSMQWLREAELKHCRVSMLAFVGAIVQGYFGFSWSGSLGGYYYEPGTNFFTEALASSIKTNSFGMAQILLSIYLVESKFFPEGAWMGYMTRAPGDLGLNVGNTKDSKVQQLKELKNGRAAMLGVMALSAAHYIPGSVPFTIPSGF